jgi:hypothetical protein
MWVGAGQGREQGVWYGGGGGGGGGGGVGVGWGGGDDPSDLTG